MSKKQKKKSNTLHNLLTGFRSLFFQDTAFEPMYRILAIEEVEDSEYEATVQITNKSHTFKMKPEEILSDDKMTDSFGPRDIRTLTYLGYLGVNSPKYKILANRLYEKDSNIIFAIKEKGKKGCIVKTAEEISTDEKFLSQLSQRDAHKIGYTTGSQNIVKEKTLKQKLIEEHKKIKSEKNS